MYNQNLITRCCWKKRWWRHTKIFMTWVFSINVCMKPKDEIPCKKSQYYLPGSDNLLAVTIGMFVATNRWKEKASMLEWFCRETCLDLTQWKTCSRIANLCETTTAVMLLEAVKTVKILWIKVLTEQAKALGRYLSTHPPTHIPGGGIHVINCI